MSYTMYVAWQGDGPIPPMGRCVCSGLHGTRREAQACAKTHGLAVREVKAAVKAAVPTPAPAYDRHCGAPSYREPRCGVCWVCVGGEPPMTLMPDPDADPDEERILGAAEAECQAAFDAHEQGLVDDPYSLIPD